MSDFDKDKIPVSVEASYKLDGQDIAPEDVVGKSGELEAHFVVTNRTGRPTELEYDDGTGKMAKTTEDVVIPMVGQLTTTLPDTFTDVTSEQASIAGDGRGGTKMTFTMTLFGPIGSPKAEFGYKTRITDGQIPAASVTAVPVNPLESPSFKGGAQAYADGAKKGIALTEGGQALDDNLLKLKEGGEQLLAGMLQIRGGTNDLRDGLADRALPGAQQLQAGAGQLRDGAGQLADGTGQLKNGTGDLVGGTGQLKNGTGELLAGSGQLKNGTGTLVDGAGQLRDGSGRLLDGTGQLKNGTGALVDGTGQLRAGSGQLLNGTTRLLDGSGQLVDGTGQLKDGSARLQGGLTQLQAGIDGNADSPGLIGGLDQVSTGLTGVANGLNTLYQGVGQLPPGIKRLLDGIGTTQAEGTLSYGVSQLRQQINEGADGLLLLNSKIYNPNGATLQEKGAYQKIDCAVRVIKQLRDGGYGTNAAGQPNAQFTDECYGEQAQLLNSVAALSAAPESNAVKRQIMTSLIQALENGRDQLADPNNLINPTDPNDIGGPNAQQQPGKKPDPQTATMQQVVAYVGGRLKYRAVPGLTLIQCGLDAYSLGNDASSPCYSPADLDPNTPGVQNFATGLKQGLELLEAGSGQLLQGIGSDTERDNRNTKTLRGGVQALQDGNAQLRAGAGAASEGVRQLREGAGALNDGAGQLDTGARALNDGAGALNAGAGQLDAGVSKAADGANALNDGAGALNTGVGELNAGVTKLGDGATALNDGAGRLNDGASRLDTGASKLNNGAQQLDAGAAKLNDGATKLDDGAGRLSDGAGTLAEGIEGAADGAGKLADGAGRAVDGNKKINDGAQQLRDQGAAKIKASGQETAADFGIKSAALNAGANLAKTDGMAVGAPEGAAGFTAYSLELVAADGTGNRNAAQGVAGLLLFGAAAAVGILWRRPV